MTDQPPPYTPGATSYGRRWDAGGPNAGPMRIPTEQAPQHHEVSDGGPTAFDRVLRTVTYIVVIITCVVILFTLFVGYSALKDMAESWNQLNQLGGL